MTIMLSRTPNIPGFTLIPLIVFSFSCSSNQDKEIARVGENIIRVANVVDVMSSGGYEESEKGAREALDYLVDFELILLEANEQGLGESEEYDLKMKLARDQLLVRKLIEVEVYDKAILSEEDILAKVAPNASESEEAEKKAKIEELLERARAGEDFTELAKEYSEGPSAHRGGDLGFHPRESIDPDFEKVVFDLQVGEISDVFRTRYGYHIAKLEERRMRTFDDMKDKLKVSLETSKRSTLSREFMSSIEERANMRAVDEGIDRMIELFENDSTGAKVREEATVLAVFEGGEWTGSDYMDLYMMIPDSLRVVPKEREEVKNFIAGRVTDAILVNEAREVGIDQLDDYREELARLEEDVLVQLYITHKLFGAEPDEEQLLSMYDSNRDRFPGDFAEEREKVVRMYKDEMEEGGLENLTNPLKDKFPVTIIEENLHYIPDLLKD
jgi:hypothetical protein